MTYKAKTALISNVPYGINVYSYEAQTGNPPPSPPIRFLLQENGQYLLQENGQRIQLELGTP